MRTTSINNIVQLVMTTSLNISSECLAGIAIENHFNHHDYKFMCKCRDCVPITEQTYMAKVVEASQLSLEGIA